MPMKRMSPSAPLADSSAKTWTCVRARWCSEVFQWEREGPLSVGGVEADREGRLEVVPRVGPEGDVRVGVDDTGHLVDPPGDDLRDLLELAHADDGDQVGVAGDGVDLADAVQVGHRLGDLADRVGGGVDHHDGGDHDREPSRAGATPAVTRSGRARVDSERSSANGLRSARLASTRARKPVNGPVPGTGQARGASTWTSRVPGFSIHRSTSSVSSTEAAGSSAGPTGVSAVASSPGRVSRTDVPRGALPAATSRP